MQAQKYDSHHIFFISSLQPYGCLDHPQDIVKGNVECSRAKAQWETRGSPRYFRKVGKLKPIMAHSHP